MTVRNQKHHSPCACRHPCPDPCHMQLCSRPTGATRTSRAASAATRSGERPSSKHTLARSMGLSIGSSRWAMAASRVESTPPLNRIRTAPGLRFWASCKPCTASHAIRGPTCYVGMCLMCSAAMVMGVVSKAAVMTEWQSWLKPARQCSSQHLSSDMSHMRLAGPGSVNHASSMTAQACSWWVVCGSTDAYRQAGAMLRSQRCLLCTAVQQACAAGMHCSLQGCADLHFDLVSPATAHRL